MTDPTQQNQRAPSSQGGDRTEDLTLPKTPRDVLSCPKGEVSDLNERRLPLSNLAVAIVNAVEHQGFSEVLAKLIDTGGDEGIQRLWSASQEILERGPDNRREISWGIAREIAKALPRRETIRGTEPSLNLVARFLVNDTRDPMNTLRFFQQNFSIEPIDVLLRHYVQRNVPGSFMYAYVMRKFQELVEDSSKAEALGSILRALVLRRDGIGLSMCVKLRERLEDSVKWVGRERESNFLWNVRDKLTREIYESPLACERNLKLALLYCKSVPHPCLRFEAQRLLGCERWILDHPAIIESVYGYNHSLRIFREAGLGTLSSASFIAATTHAVARGVQEAQSRFDRDSHVLLPLYNFLGVPHQGAGPCAVEKPPRTWLSQGDEVRFQSSRIQTAFKILDEVYWAHELPDRVREKGRELLRAVVRAQPYAVAESASTVRKLTQYFVRDLYQIVGEEAIQAAKRPSVSALDRARFRESFVVASAFGMSIPDVNPQALRELERVLARVNHRELSDYATTAFLAASRSTASTTPAVESRAISLIRRFPDTLGASLLARSLFEVRCPDESVKQIVRSQAMRENLKPEVWLNYAHAAIGYGLEPVEREVLKPVFRERYDSSVRGFGRWCPRARVSFRLLIGDLFPEDIGNVRPFNEASQALHSSPLERRIIKRLELVPGIKVNQDVYLPWAPSIDGVLACEGAANRPILMLIDGESYHSVNGKWSFRGFDGHTALATRILTRAGYPVVRIAAQLGEAELEASLQEAFAAIRRYVVHGEPPTASCLIVDPPESYTDIAGKVLFYNCVGSHREVSPMWRDGTSLGEMLGDGEAHAEGHGDFVDGF